MFFPPPEREKERDRKRKDVGSLPIRDPVSVTMTLVCRESVFHGVRYGSRAGRDRKVTTLCYVKGNEFGQT